MDIKDYEQKKGETHFWHRARLNLLDFLLQPVPKNSRLASVGCGTGEEMALLAAKGQVIGLDINQQALALASQQGYQAELFNITTDSLPPIYDAIGAFDVLEHITDDELAIKNIWQSLKPQGYFLITVPAYQWLFSSHDIALEHKRRYSKQELRRKLSAAGFTIELLGYWNCLMAPVVIINRLLKKIWQPKINLSEAKTPASFINSCGYAILSLENIFIKNGGRWPWGISLYVRAKKL